VVVVVEDGGKLDEVGCKYGGFVFGGGPAENRVVALDQPRKLVLFGLGEERGIEFRRWWLAVFVQDA